jgi:pimeloyl-ACP methyl ester carboxylesterase
MRGDTECLPAVEYVKGWRAARPILLLPGLFAGDWIWKPAWDCLIAGGFSVAKLSEPFAALDTESTSIDSLRSVVMGVLDEYEIREAVICGNSLGGLVAQAGGLRIGRLSACPTWRNSRGRMSARLRRRCSSIARRSRLS